MPNTDNDARLKIGGQIFDPEDLTYGEKREVRRIIRDELWDSGDGALDWDAVTENEVLPATITVFMRRGDPEYTVQQALDLKPRDIYIAADGPPTPGSSVPASARKTRSARAGSRS